MDQHNTQSMLTLSRRFVLTGEGRLQITHAGLKLAEQIEKVPAL
jgi:predicted flavoprotein YhiN